MANDRKQVAMNLSMEELDRVVKQCIREEYTLIVCVTATATKDVVHVSLEKGSAYGSMHMKFTANADTILEAFNKAYANFPVNPVGARWDTKQLVHQTETPVDGEFTEIPPVQPPSTPVDEYLAGISSKTKARSDDDIPF